MADPETPSEQSVEAALAAEELSLKREEFTARRAEAQAKIRATTAPLWRRADPLVLAVLAGVITLAGNMFIAWYNAQNSVFEENFRAKNALDLEKEKAKGTLIIQALSTSDAVIAQRNLLFFVDAGLIEDKERKLRTAAEKYGPVLPSAGAPTHPPTTGEDYRSAFVSAKIRPELVSAIDASVDKIVAARPKLEALASAVHSPWYVIGVFWMLETGGSFTMQFNGTALPAPAANIPAGAPVGGTPEGGDLWQASAVDQIVKYKLNNLNTADIGSILSALERANGTGYQRRGIFTPYLWGGTNFYDKGKYVADGHWDPNAVSKQVGAVAVLRRLQDKKIIDLTATLANSQSQ